MGIREDWTLRTIAVKMRSAELKRVDTGVLTWINKGPGAGSSNLQTLWTDFSAWKQSKAAEYNIIRQAADALQEELAKFWKPVAANLGGAVKSSETKPIGWTLVGEGNPVTLGCNWLPDSQKAAPLTSTEITRINEAFRRATFGAVAARDALIKLRQTGIDNASGPTKQAYLDFFGTYSEARFKKVMDNLTALALAFGNQPNVTDVRNWTLWSTTYGGCVRANIVSKSGGSVSLTGKVDILIGRAFLTGGNYGMSTDATVGTLVHEFAHGTFRAADVPEVNANGDFGCARQSDVPDHQDFGNSTDPHNHQASTEANDMLLAQHKPDYAVVNADCYGQFVRRIIMAQVK